MNMMDTANRTLTRQNLTLDILLNSKKNDYEVEVNTAWRRAEPDCVEHLLEHSQISEELNQTYL